MSAEGRMSPLVGIAAAHLLITRHPRLSDMPLRWDFHPEYGPDISVIGSDDVNVAAIVAEVAAMVGAEVETGCSFESPSRGVRLLPLRVNVRVDGVVLPLSAYEPMPLLPVREVHTDAEQQLCADWIDQHGDPADWSQETRLAYANVLANLRAGGAL